MTRRGSGVRIPYGPPDVTRPSSLVTFASGRHTPAPEEPKGSHTRSAAPQEPFHRDSGGASTVGATACGYTCATMRAPSWPSTPATRWSGSPSAEACLLAQTVGRAVREDAWAILGT